MLSKNQISFIKSLTDRKERATQQLFVAEGEKTFHEVIRSKLIIMRLYASAKWLADHGKVLTKNIEIHETGPDELKKISSHQAPQEPLMLIQIPDKGLDSVNFRGKVTLLLDTIQDPGNLGTMVRLADWYGIERVICSPDSVDIYNSKSINASMGSFCRIPVHYCDLADFITQHPDIPVYGALLEGKNIHRENLAAEAFIIIGNEGNGISAGLKSLIRFPIHIPRFGEAESLNAAMAAAVILDNFKRGSGTA